jgi:hypothetical protein
MSKNNHFAAGFFSPSYPGIAWIWRSKEEDDELCTRPEAERRFDKLAKRMSKGKKVDGLEVASVFIRDESTGEAVRSMTQDGTEAQARAHDLGMFFNLVKGQA